MQPIFRPDCPVRFSFARGGGSHSGSGLRMLGLFLLLGLLTPRPASAQFGLKSRYFTTGSTLRKSFSEVVSQARLSTVQVRSGKRQVAFGIVVGSEGWIVTKASELGSEPQVVLPNGDELPAEVSGTHEETDLALLKVDAHDLTPIEWDNRLPEIGQWVISSGNRETPEAIGVVGTKPIKVARQRIPGVLGVRLDGDAGSPTVEFVFPNSGAESAGLQAGDIVLRLNGVNVTNRGFMTSRIQKLNPGDAVKLEIRREDEELTIEATLTPPPNNEFLSRIAIQNQMGGELSQRRTGFESVIQHDSVLSPEEIGGPAVALNGKAIGINIARAGRTETYALPARLVLPVIEELKLKAPSSIVSKE
ncbi:MAG: S1C family serine protease [Planctomycetaceae bacterium]